MSDSLRFFASPSNQSTTSRSGSFTETNALVFDRSQQGIGGPGWDSLDYIMEAENQSLSSESPVVKKAADYEKNSASNKQYAVQAKLNVGPADDMYEREADAVADRVMRQDNDDLYMEREPITPLNPALQRQTTVSTSATAGEHSQFNQASARINQSRGAKLDQADRKFFESRMGHDFGDVQIHDDQESAEAARLLQAKAFTIGTDVYFGANQNTRSDVGKHLMAQELTHVVQQRSGIVGNSMAQRQSAETPAELSAYDKIDRLIDTVLDSDQYVDDILGDVWESVEEHWPWFLATFVGILGVEILAAALLAAPEPTMITKLLAGALQLLLLGIYGKMLFVSADEAIGAASEWYQLATKPDATEAELTEASKAFLRMILHLLLGILSAAGFRAKIGGTVKAANLPVRNTGASTRQPLQVQKPSRKDPQQPKPSVRTPEQMKPPPKPRAQQGGARRLPDIRGLVKTPVEKIVGPNPKYDALQGFASARQVLALAIKIMKHKGTHPALIKGIALRKTDIPGRYAIVDGTHRYLALKLLGREVREEMLDLSQLSQPPVVPGLWSRFQWMYKERALFGKVQ